MKILLIRHGRTKGNAEHRYVGKTNEDLLPEETEHLKKKQPELRQMLAGSAPEIYASPMKRCLKTAKALFEDPDPGRKEPVIQIVPDLREMDFGEFEYCNYKELEADPLKARAYQNYIDSNGERAFPKGESKAQFEDRILSAAIPLFENFLQEDVSKLKKGTEEARKTPVLVVHGGTIMAILDRLSEPHRDYFDWRAGPGEGFAADLVKKDRKICLCGIIPILTNLSGS